MPYSVISDELISKTALNNEISAERIIAVLQGTKKFFAPSATVRKKVFSMLKATLGEELLKDSIIYAGCAVHLLPREISNILRICIKANFDFRVKRLMDTRKVNNTEAIKTIKNKDKQAAGLSISIHGKTPWEESLYDILIPMDLTTVDEAVELIIENVKKEIIKTTDYSKKLLQDFVLSAKVNALLLEKNIDVEVRADGENIEILIKKYTFRMESLRQDAEKIALRIPGVKNVTVGISKSFKMPTTYPPVDLDIPNKILLVDDEVEFVQTLSERLQTRQMKSLVAYNGEEALKSLNDEEKEVVVLDLRMPGIDGFEVLKTIKIKYPHTEEIILTGHGSDMEKHLAMELGAFAYLEKPVDINELSLTMKRAYSKVKRAKYL